MGGSLFLNAAPNEGDGMSYGFGGVALTYPEFPANPGNAVDPAHPIWLGPALPVALQFTGGSYAHASVSGPALIPHIQDSDGGDPNLAEQGWGCGDVLFGGLTTSKGMLLGRAAARGRPRRCPPRRSPDRAFSS